MARSNIQQMKINHLDLFSGIGGFHLGFERAGYEITSYFSEIDKHAVAVYKHQFPTSTYVGSVTDVRGADLPNINLITFGSPCQDFSLAGKRKGMEGQRSSLVLEAIRLISECRPSVFVWENVKGTFSSNDGADFWAIIQAFANIGGYRLEWQLLNTSWFLPQNRERIYLVGYSTTTGGDWRGVFPIGETSELSNSKKFNEGQESTGLQDEDYIARALNARPAFGSGSEDTFIKVQSATSQGYEEATIGDSINFSQPNSETRRGRVGKQKAQTLETSCNQAVVESNFTIGDIRYDGGGFRPRDNGVAPALTNFSYNSCSILRDNNTFRIRRLTPIECERLQGFPDQHTAYGNYDGVVKPMSNTQRYRQCGNAVTVDVVAAVAKKCLPLFN
jgi:DNA (cytosine-5)-methyltransferase 1